VAVDQARIAAAVAEILAAIGEDPGRVGLESTPQRVAAAYAEFFAGLGRNPLDHLTDSVPVGESTGDLVLLRDIEFRSVCEHHLLPFLGVAHLAYLPGNRIVGLGKLANLVETLAARPQLQERLTDEIADALEAGLAPRGILVMLDASHGCVTTRGPRQSRSSTVTLAARGELADAGYRSEIITLIGGSR
jgi:GTP cyclohydrolase I